MEKLLMRKMYLELDELDYIAIQRVITTQQLYDSLPDGEGNLAGRILAEICRGWEELQAAFPNIENNSTDNDLFDTDNDFFN